jgi:chromosomal replication initiator protein
MFGVWQDVLDEIAQNVPSGSFTTWFKDSELVGLEDGVVTIGVKNVFFVKQFAVRHDRVVRKALKNIGVEFRDVKYVVSGGATVKKKVVNREVTAEDVRRPTVKKVGQIRKGGIYGGAMENGLNPRYRFDNFVVGSNNDLAVSAARAVVDNPGDRYNPYFIYGGSGLGKTHLIQAIGNELAAVNPGMKILYVTVEQFYHEFVESVRKNIKGFAEKYRRVDVLIVDDIQLIAGKDKSQEEFFHTFNDLYQRNKQIIVSSDRLPNQIATVDERLASRLAAGIPVDIQMPSFEVRCAILKAKAEFVGIKIANDAIEYLANNVRTNVRDLEGKFNQLVALSELKGVSPDEIIDDGYLVDIRNARIKTVSSKQVIEIVAKFFNITAKEMCGESRSRHVLVPRQVAMYLLAEELNMSTPKICVELGRKDHTTAMHSVRKIKNDLKLDFGLRQQISALREKIYG